jgi:3,4-dihydroxy 2-butanone 4-phosphate synthase/GTP cyclohydrolase II
VEANVELGFQEDERDYGVGAGILHSLGIRKMRLITNNPVKKAGLEGYGISIVETIPLEVTPNKHNQFYLQTKRDKMGHFLNIAQYDNPQNDGK